MKPFSDCLTEYRKQVNKGEIVTAYRGLMEYILTLRNHFRNKYPGYTVPGTFYSGYMDMTYFPIVSEKLKTKGLKIAFVLVHDKLRFEAWLSGCNKGIQAKYQKFVLERKWEKYKVQSTLKETDSIVECVLAENPDFEDLPALTRQLEEGVEKFIEDVEAFIG